MHLEKFVRSRTGRWVMSILLGLGVASLFHRVCKGKHCYVERAPPADELEDGQVYKFDGKCYEMKRQAVSCDASKKTLAMTAQA